MLTSTGKGITVATSVKAMFGMVELASGIMARLLSTGMTFYPVMMTPEIAQQLLDNRAPNRGIRSSTVKRYLRDIEGGRWLLSPQCILIDTQGRLIDGQHRLSAIVAGGVPVPVVVCVNVPDGVFGVIDEGTKRSSADVLRISSDTTSVAQALAGWTPSGRKVQLSRSELQDVVSAFSDEIAFVIVNVMNFNAKRISTAPVAAQIAMALVAGEDRDRLAEFCQVLRDGYSLSSTPGDDTPALVARKMLTEIKSAGRPFAEHLRKLQRLIQAFCRRERLTKVYDPGSAIYPAPNYVTRDV